MQSKPHPYTIAVLCDLRDAEGRILLLHRAKQPNKDLYSLIGGKLEQHLGESPAQCARREIHEEAGIDVQPEHIKLVAMISEEAFNDSGHWLLFVYRVQIPVDVIEHSMREGSLEWHDPDNIHSLPQPETDRRVIWPLLREHEDSFFTAHIDCTSKEMAWTVEQVI